MNPLSLIQTFVSVWSARHLHLPIKEMPFVYLDITDRCNSACLACDIWKIRKVPPAELDTDDILSLKPALKRLKTRLISIGGGEPTLRDDLETCIAGFRDMGVSVHLNTNALEIDHNRAKSLAKAGLSVVYISCDHPDRDGYKAIRGVDGLDRVIRAMRCFRSLPHPIPVGINMTVSRLNQDAPERLAQKCVGWGVQKIQFNLIHTHLQHRYMDKKRFARLLPRQMDVLDIKRRLRRVTGGLRKLGIATNSDSFVEHLDKTYARLRAVPCMAGFSSVVINPWGEVMPCYMHPTGLNIRNNALDRLLRLSEYQERMDWVRACKIPCWDTGSAEPSIRFHLPYLLTHLAEVWQQAQMHLSGPPPIRP